MNVRTEYWLFLSATLVIIFGSAVIGDPWLFIGWAGGILFGMMVLGGRV